MNRKIVGIFICTLLIILTAFPSFGKMTEQSFVRNNDYVMNNKTDIILFTALSRVIPVKGTDPPSQRILKSSLLFFNLLQYINDGIAELVTLT